MAGNEVSVSDISHNRRNLTALIGAVSASGMELTALRRICGAGKLALQGYGIGLLVGVSHGNRREECLSVRMLCVVANFLCSTHLNDVAKVHYRDIVGDVLNNGKAFLRKC